MLKSMSINKGFFNIALDRLAIALQANQVAGLKI